MKTKDRKSEIKGLTLDGLKEKNRSLAEEKMKLSFRAKTGRLEQGHLHKEVRRDRARVLTRLKQLRTEGQA